MKKTLLLVTLLLAMSSMGWAGACGTGTLADYTAAGFSCTIGDKTFSDFNYASSAVGATPIPASGVAVLPQFTGTEEGFLFSAGWSAGPGQISDSLIGYTVTTTHLIVDAVLKMGGFGFTGDGNVTVGENLTNGANLFIFSNSGGTLSSESVTFAGVKSLTVQFKDVTVAGNSGTAGVSAVTNLFSQSVPEPSSMLLLGSGLMTLAGYIRRQRKASM